MEIEENKKKLLPIQRSRESATRVGSLRGVPWNDEFTNHTYEVNGVKVKICVRAIIVSCTST